ncbi:endonuclease domain-containing protein [Herbiconiux sp. CPCC 205763]|uniref:Endonuclease domain-containing protein n=1 Tax=Herbiconiux aconitum TaxID=2970913 RepID=A0ABT2GSW4_9MICO|nr:endonuclease domain-containing protein [Herbiconiux aconitum]MCS5718652.1 endonuclease domain-containing protein [Herbiconiux aconitum]
MPRKDPLPEPLRRSPFALAQALDLGVGTDRLRGDDLARPFRGVRVARGGPLSLVQHCHAYARRMRDIEFFSHLTAAELWGVPLPTEWRDGADIHVSTVGQRRAAKARGVIGHQISDELLVVATRYGLPLSDPSTTWCHLASSLSDDDLVAAGDHLVLTPARQVPRDPRPYCTVQELAERVAAFRGRGSVRARRVVAQVRDGAESRRETLVRLRLLAAGLPEPEIGINVFDASGTWIARVDMIYPAWKVIVEYDGDQHRTSTRQYERDIRRLDDLHEAGNRVVRIRNSTLALAPTLVRHALRAAGAPV